ncbi:hypothetical protein GGX14DRAFT_299518, partial [Mycena pura]
RDGRIFAVLAGQPDNTHYTNVVQRAYTTLVHLGTFTPSFRKHCRGLFAALNVGLSYGQGQTEPSWLKSDYSETAEALLEDPDLHMASFANGAFFIRLPSPNPRVCVLGPRLYQYYASCNSRLQGRRPFPKSAFSCAAFNFGPNAWTFKHRDVLDLPFGWCGIQALGRFNLKKCGHL